MPSEAGGTAASFSKGRNEWTNQKEGEVLLQAAARPQNRRNGRGAVTRPRPSRPQLHPQLYMTFSQS